MLGIADRSESVSQVGIIKSIFQYSHGQNRDAAPAIAIAQPVKEIYLVVKELVPADTSDGFSDPYKRYGFAGGSGIRASKAGDEGCDDVLAGGGS